MPTSARSGRFVTEGLREDQDPLLRFLWMNVWRAQKSPPRRGGLFFYFFMEALTICMISSEVFMGLAISFLVQTTAHRPQELHFS